MPFTLQLALSLQRAGWKVKIHDKEGPETPHVTIYCKRRRWRLSLRDRKTFLDRDHKWSQIDKGVRKTIEDNWMTLQTEWDRIHPHNPIRGDDDDDGDAQ